MSAAKRQTRSDRLIRDVADALAARPASETQAVAHVESAARVVTQVRSLLEENEGLADEVLRGYEQLNLIFDFTQQIATLTSADEIVDVLLCRLAELLAAKAVYVVGADGRRRLYDVSRRTVQRIDGIDPVEKELTGAIAQMRAARKVCVTTADDAEALVGPLPRLNGRLDAVIVLRDRAAGSFLSGDVLLVESVLAFGGQIISNSELHQTLRQASMETTRALVAAIDQKDHYTCGHSERVGRLARLTGRELGLPPAQLEVLELAGLLHDVGKIGVPEEILNKPGKLTPEEFEVIKKHPDMGYEILRPVASFGSVLDAVLYHHENPDGTGYPRGLKGDAIPPFARIIHVVDVFDALSSNRSYRSAFTFDRACQIIRGEAGTKLDAATAEAFLRVYDRLQTESPNPLLQMYRADQEAADVPG